MPHRSQESTDASPSSDTPHTLQCSLIQDCLIHCASTVTAIYSGLAQPAKVSHHCELQVISEDLGLSLEKVDISALGRAKKVHSLLTPC